MALTLKDSPLWLKAVLQMGVPAALALYLTWALVGDLRSDVSAMRNEHRDLLFYARGICLNTAADESAERRCMLHSEGR